MPSLEIPQVILPDVTVTGKRSAVIGNASATNVLNSDGTITQTERLFTTRARYASLDGRTIQNPSGNVSGRGPNAYIKLLTSQTQYSEYISGSTKRDLTFKDLVGNDGDLTNMSDPKDSNTFGYDKFLLTGVQASFDEKVQITQVFGDAEVVYYFGRQPIVFTLSGVLIDSVDNNWFTDWIKIYSEALRGTQLAKNYELLKIILPNMAITGSIMNFSWQQNSARDVDIPFSFQFLARVVEPLPAVNSGIPLNSQIAGVDFSQAGSFIGQKEINSIKGQVANLVSVIQDPASTLQQKAVALQQIGTGVGGTFGANAKDTSDGFQSTVNGWVQSENNFFSDVRQTAVFQTVTSSLNGIRTNLFSPIYGVLTSLTKLVTNTFGQATSIFDSVITPVRNVLRDITNISTQAISLVNLVDASITGFGRYVSGELRGVDADYHTALRSLSMAAGVIATAPATASQSIAHMFQTGALSSSCPFLVSPIKASFTRPTLTSGTDTIINRIALLRSIPAYTPATSNSL